MTVSKASVSFDEYSKKYDMLLQYSPPYQEIGKFIIIELQKIYSPEAKFSVLDIGGGTGNFSKIVTDEFPNAIIHLLEPNDKMLAIAKHKLRDTKSTYSKVSFQNFKNSNKYDILLCVHALYLMPSSITLIPYFQKFMQQETRLIICDIGKVINVFDWTLFLFNENRRKHGLLKAIQIIKTASEIKKSNREIAKNQKNGQLWQHNLQGFKNYFEEYYQIQTAFTCYRGCSNFLVCQKK